MITANIMSRAHVCKDFAKHGVDQRFANLQIFMGVRGPKTEVEEHPSVSRETSFLTPEIRTFFSEDCLSKTWTLRSAAGLPPAIRGKPSNINGLRAVSLNWLWGP
jgi:hypothetical protein